MLTTRFTLVFLLAIIALSMHSGFQPINAASSIIKKVLKYDRDKNCAGDLNPHLNPSTYLTYFNCGHVNVLKNGTTVRTFALIIHEDIKVPITMGNPSTNTPAIMYPAWTFNGSIPAPTIRMTQGDHVSIKVWNNGTMPHSFHMHSIHPGIVDGTMFNNASGAIPPGSSYTYNFTADPVGLWPFHCHMMPLALHITRGLYGHMIIDPPANQARPIMHEMNMIMNGFDLTLNSKSESLRLPTFQEANQMLAGNDTVAESLPQEHDNQVYALNTVAFYYDVHPIPIKLNEPYRFYLTNMLDFDFANTLHLHGTVFQYYPSATSTTPTMTNDIVSLGQGDRGILELQYHFPGVYMIHSHFESQAGRGWEGLLKVTDPAHVIGDAVGAGAPVGNSHGTSTAVQPGPITPSSTNSSSNNIGNNSSNNNNTTPSHSSNNHGGSSSNNSNHHNNSSHSSSSNNGGNSGSSHSSNNSNGKSSSSNSNHSSHSSNNNNSNNNNNSHSKSNHSNNNNSNNNNDSSHNSSNHNSSHSNNNNSSHTSSHSSHNSSSHSSHNSSSHSSHNSGSGNNSNTSSQSNSKGN